VLVNFICVIKNNNDNFDIVILKPRVGKLIIKYINKILSSRVLNKISNNLLMFINVYLKNRIFVNIYIFQIYYFMTTFFICHLELVSHEQVTSFHSVVVFFVSSFVPINMRHMLENK